MHEFSRRHPELGALDRYSYDEPLFDNIAAQIAQGDESGAFADAAGDILRASDAICARIAELKALPGQFGVIHADMSKGNLIICGDDISPIDFCLSGRGCYRQDIGGLYDVFSGHTDALFEGYSSVSGEPVSKSDAILFLAFGVLLFIGAQWSRHYKEEWFAGAVQRWRRDLFLKLLER